jgi:hypothetical protein
VRQHWLDADTKARFMLTPPKQALSKYDHSGRAGKPPNRPWISDPRTKTYAARPTTEGKTPKEIIRCF